MIVQLTEREIAIVCAALRCCIGWTAPRELERFVNVAAESVRGGWSEEEMEQVLETIAGQYSETKHPYDTRS